MAEVDTLGLEQFTWIDMDKVQEILKVLSETIRAQCPYDTGALSQSIDTYYNGNTAQVVIGNDLVDYARITNETWEKRHNPNEGWVQRAIESCVPVIQAILSGDATQDEIDKYVGIQKGAYRLRQQMKATSLESE